MNSFIFKNAAYTNANVRRCATLCIECTHATPIITDAMAFFHALAQSSSSIRPKARDRPLAFGWRSLRRLLAQCACEPPVFAPLPPASPPSSSDSLRPASNFWRLCSCTTGSIFARVMRSSPSAAAMDRRRMARFDRAAAVASPSSQSSPSLSSSLSLVRKPFDRRMRCSLLQRACCANMRSCGATRARC